MPRLLVHLHVFSLKDAVMGHVRDGLDWCSSSIFQCQRFYCCDLEGTQSLHFILKISCSSHDLPLPHTVYFYSATFHHLFINLAVCVIPCVMHHFQTILQKSLLGEMCPLYLTQATYLRAVGARSAGTNCRLKLCSSKGRWLIDAIHLKVSILSS